MRPVIVFDVNETLLNLEPVRTWFDTRFDGRIVASQWFGELLRLSFVSATTDRYSPFTSLAVDALRTTAATGGIRTSQDDAETLGQLMRSLRPHPDARKGIEDLVRAGFTVAALTNSPQEAANAQLNHAGLDDLLDPILSVEMVRRFKPHASVYRAAAERLGVSLSDMVMVAAHDWDIAGAMAAGCRGTFIERGGRPYSSAFPPPSATARDVVHAADQLIEATT
jgi:2-haloacid dehalogenase